MKRHPSPASEPAELLDHVLVNAFLENVPDLVYFKDCTSRFLAVSRSKAARHGLDPADMVGKTDEDFFSEEHAQWARVDEENILNTGEPVIGKLERIVWPDGRETWAQTTKMPLRAERGEIIGTFGLTHDVTQDQEMRQELEKAKRHLVATSRLAGMAEVATGVLHNVGNVLTSLNVSAGVIATSLHQSKVESLGKLAALLNEHAGDLGEFVTSDPKGKLVPDFLDSLAKHAAEERDRLLDEIASLQANVDHIKEIVTMQQAYATTVGMVEPLDAALLMDDSLRMNAVALVRHDVRVVRNYQPVAPVVAERSKVLQILVNLIRNAKYAAEESGRVDKQITLRVEAGAEGFARLVVQDNGIGIPAENLTRIFEHGFTTRAAGGGHGFGLCSAATAAREMKGALTVHSLGRGQGASFILDLPLAPEGTIAANAPCAPR
jgi:PAS domain S-box-containing protein